MQNPHNPSSKEWVPFNRPAQTGAELIHLQDVLKHVELTADRFVLRCREWLAGQLTVRSVHMTPSCTHALEMAALLLNIQQGDEIIMPSYTFVSTANAFVLRGGTPVFVDIRPDTMNIDDTKIEAAITERTRAIIVMHYGGVACEMETIDRIAKRHAIPIIEDAAHALMAKWRDRYLGTLGAMGCFSFHQTKNFTAGEGGALILNDDTLAPQAEILEHKGTNRARFLRDETPYYSWVDRGSAWIMNELNAAYLYGNLLAADAILKKRHALWDGYYSSLLSLQQKGFINLPAIPPDCQHNAHIFYIKVSDKKNRDDFLHYLKSQNIGALFHYVPLHTSPAGLKFGRFQGEDLYTTRESERLVRLPLFYNMAPEQSERVISAIHRYYAQ